MNCREFKANMAELFDKNPEEAMITELRDHMQQCPDCDEEYHQSLEMMTLLKPEIKLSAPSLLKQEIINRLIKDEAKMKNQTTKVRWIHSRTAKVLSVAAVLILAMIIVPIAFRNNPYLNSTVKAADRYFEMSKSASQMIKSMVIKLKVRTVAHDNFELIGTDYQWVDHTITKSFENPGKWRIDKGERVVVFDGVNQYLWMPNFDEGIKAGPKAGFISWMRILLDPQDILSREQKAAKERNSKVTMDQNGDETIMTITSNARGNFINDYGKNKTIEESDNRREYTFDSNTKLLKGLKIYILHGKKETLIMETEHIDYDIPVDPSLFVINLPQGIEWKELTTDKYSSERFRNITSKRAAELFFQGIANNDWKLVGETCDFFNNPSEKVKKVKEEFGGLTVIKIGEPFKSGLYRGVFVPYEIKFKSGKVKKYNLAVRNDNPNKMWVVDGGF